MARAIVKFGYATAYEVAPENIGDLMKILAKMAPVAYTYREGKEIWFYDKTRSNIHVEFVPVVLIEPPPELESD